MQFPWQPKFDINSFKSDNWKSLSDGARKKQLQALENDMAKEQGRKPRRVVIDPAYSDGGCYTTDGKGGGTIHVSRNDLHKNSFECMDTVIHEGRHAYQDDVINNRITNSEADDIKLSWAHNDLDGCYITNSEGSCCDYYYQPQEADAYGFAKLKMDDRSSLFADDPQYQDYLANRE